MEKPRIIALCGSTRFREEFDAMAEQLTLAGNIVLMPHVWARHGMPADAKLRLDELCLYMIDLADEVIIVAPGFYVGHSTQAEIDYAERKGKRVGWSHGEPMVEHTDREEQRIADGEYE